MAAGNKAWAARFGVAYCTAAAFLAATLGSSSMCLVSINDWDFNWQGMYRYKDPIAIPVGTKVSLNAFYDNSTDNIRKALERMGEFLSNRKAA